MAGIVCQVCGNKNLAGAILCSECHSLLIETHQGTETFSSQTMVPYSEDTPPTAIKRNIASMGAESIALYVNDNPDPLVVHVTRQAVLGRYSANSTSQPRIDLTHFGAFERGISRLHAVIRREEETLLIEDLGSSNGTWHNGNKLTPYQSSALQSGDQLKLGTLYIQIVF